MNQTVEIRKKKSALRAAVSQALIFSGLALLFFFNRDAEGKINTFLVILFAALSLFGWAMIIDYYKSSLCIDEEGIIARGPFGKEKRIGWKEIESIGAQKSFLFVYGKKNRVLASLDASLSDYPQAKEMLVSHGVIIHDHHFRKRKES